MDVDKRSKHGRPSITRSGSRDSIASPVADAEGAMEAAQSLVHVETMESQFKQLSRLCEA